MSLATWKKEFYRTPADKVSKRYALRHSIQKWTGLLSRNRRRHKVYLKAGILFEGRSDLGLEINGDSCALCKHHSKVDCDSCPVSLVNNNNYCPCGDAYESMMAYSKVTPMINLLKRALEKGKKKNEKTS